MRAMPKDRFDHLFIAHSNFDRAVAFYRDSLGWSSIATWGADGEPRGVILNGGAIELILAERHDTDDHFMVTRNERASPHRASDSRES